MNRCVAALLLLPLLVGCGGGSEAASPSPVARLDAPAITCEGLSAANCALAEAAVLPFASTFAFPASSVEITEMTYCAGYVPGGLAPTCPRPLDSIGSGIVTFGAAGKQAYYTLVRDGSGLRADFLELVAAAPATPLPPETAGTAGPTAAGASPPPTPLPTAIGGMPILDVPGEVFRAVDVADSLVPQPGGPPTGPYDYQLANGGGQKLFVVDVGGGSVRQVAAALGPQEHISQALVDGGWMALMIWRHTGTPPTEMGIPCSGNEGQPIAWRIEVARLGPNGLPATAWQRIDGGLATRGFRPPDAGEYCDGPQVPSLALAGGWVAYAVEAPTVLDPGGSRVLVRSVADGALVRTYDAPEEVLLVALSVTSVAWSETANELLGARAPSWRLVQATIDRGQPRTVPIGVEPTPARNFPPLFLLDGDALIVTIDDFAAVTSSVVRITGGSLETIDAGMPGRSCGAWAAITNLVLFYCQDQQPADWIAVWTPDAGLRAIAVKDSADNGVQGFDGRWLVLSHYDYARQQSSIEGVPVAALR